MELQGRGNYQVENGVLIINSEAETDYFVNPVDGNSINDAALVFEIIEGDFVCKARIDLTHKSMFDAGVLLAFQDDNHWAKACFEKNDDGDLCICTVMTDGVSDDCSGPIVTQGYVWLQLSRKDDIFAVHYSLDNTKWHMTRLAKLPLVKELKVGFVSQSPTGEGTVVEFSEYSIEKKSLNDSRKGI